MGCAFAKEKEKAAEETKRRMSDFSDEALLEMAVAFNAAQQGVNDPSLLGACERSRAGGRAARVLALARTTPLSLRSPFPPGLLPALRHRAQQL